MLPGKETQRFYKECDKDGVHEYYYRKDDLSIP